MEILIHPTIDLLAMLKNLYQGKKKCIECLSIVIFFYFVYYENSFCFKKYYHEVFFFQNKHPCVERFSIILKNIKNYETTFNM